MAFTWHSAGHAFASLFKDVVTVSKKVVTVLSGIQNEEKLIESLTSLVSPQAAAVEQIAFGALGALVAAVQASRDGGQRERRQRGLRCFCSSRSEKAYRGFS